MLRKSFLEKIKLNELKQYEIALKAGLHPATLSKIVNGAEPIKVGDPRVLSVAHVLGIPESEVFEKECSK